ncbi:MAG: flagellar hook-length control protein FliK, partial [Desulfovibrionaceae bacterium]|nr:flagellar hook-length control protein FliK [Desulfovibrionaceae bacterium]
GLLTTLKNGTTQLELQLHPQELGTIAVTLTSRNGEVSAHIRADNEQTVEMLHKQAEIIKANLLEQGVQIDKIEVELRNQSDSDYQAWQNMDQHNSFQEEEARRDQLRRLRNLANLENKASAAENSTLERHMHRDGQSGNNATRVLDKVA